MPSYGGAHGPDGSKKTGDQGQGTRDKNGGQTGSRGGRGGARTAKSVGNATVADHAIATGRVSAPSVPSGGVARGNYNSQVDAYNDYAKAVGDYETRGFFGKAMDFLGGSFYDQQEPMAGNPRSFAGGTYHSTSNPGGILAGMAGMAVPGLGMLAGPALGSAYTASGLPQMWHGGYTQPDMRPGVFGNTTSPMGGTQAAANSAVGGGGWFSGGLGGRPSPLSGGNNSQYGGVLAPQPAQPSIPQQAATGWGPPPSVNPQSYWPQQQNQQWNTPMSGNWSWGSWG